MMKLISVLLFIIFINLMLIFLNLNLQKKNLFSMEKNSPYECGFSSFLISHLSFSNQFFIIGLIFLIFDVEITLILPLIPSSLYTSNLCWISSSIMFLFILALGLIIEWAENSLNWLD